MLELCEVAETTHKHQSKTNLDHPLVLVVACAMPQERLLRGRGVIEYHLPSVLNNNIQICDRGWRNQETYAI